MENYPRVEFEDHLRIIYPKLIPNYQRMDLRKREYNAEKLRDEWQYPTQRALLGPKMRFKDPVVIWFNYIYNAKQEIDVDNRVHSFIINGIKQSKTIPDDTADMVSVMVTGERRDSDTAHTEVWVMPQKVFAMAYLERVTKGAFLSKKGVWVPYPERVDKNNLSTR